MHLPSSQKKTAVHYEATIRTITQIVEQYKTPSAIIMVSEKTAWRADTHPPEMKNADDYSANLHKKQIMVMLKGAVMTASPLDAMSPDFTAALTAGPAGFSLNGCTKPPHF